MGISKETFVNLYGQRPARPKAGKIIDMSFDFTELNKIMPHPVYGWMSWIGVLNPDKNTFEKLLPFIEEGYRLAKDKYKKKIKALNK